MRVFSQTNSAIIAYKDPVENQHVKKIIDKFVTGIFVVIFGILWYCSTRYYVKPNQYTIVIYDIFGKQIKIDAIRTDFRTYQVANNYILEYQNRFPHYSFSLATEMPDIKQRKVLKIFKKIQR